MINFERIIGFDWDTGSREKNVRHGVMQREAEQVFFDPAILVVADVKHSTAEPRFQALGQTDDSRPLHVTFTLRADNTLIRVISARPMSRKERKLYEAET